MYSFCMLNFSADMMLTSSKIFFKETLMMQTVIIKILLQMSAFRTLRFLFSMERNRHVFKELFPPDLFEKFIDVGHYNKDLKAYKPLVDTLNKLPVSIVHIIYYT